MRNGVRGITNSRVPSTRPTWPSRGISDNSHGAAGWHRQAYRPPPDCGRSTTRLHRDNHAARPATSGSASPLGGKRALDFSEHFVVVNESSGPSIGTTLFNRCFEGLLANHVLRKGLADEGSLRLTPR